MANSSNSNTNTNSKARQTHKLIWAPSQTVTQTHTHKLCRKPSRGGKNSLPLPPFLSVGANSRSAHVIGAFHLCKSSRAGCHVLGDTLGSPPSLNRVARRMGSRPPARSAFLRSLFLSFSGCNSCNGCNLQERLHGATCTVRLAASELSYVRRRRRRQRSSPADKQWSSPLSLLHT